MGGRLLAGFAAEHGGWQWGVAANTLLGLVALLVFVLVLPRHTFGTPARRAGSDSGPGLGRRLRAAMTTRGLVPMYAQALLLMGAFMAVYNVLGFRLTDEPFGLSQAAASLLFLSYTAGMLGSAVAGSATLRWGRYGVLTTATLFLLLGLAGLFTTSVLLLLGTLLLLTFAFFCAHATASAWVGSHAVTGRAQATAVYTLAYYLGASLFGWLGGVVYDAVGWNGTVALALGLTVLAALFALRLRGLPAPEPLTRSR